jgi:hypothetical protein
MIFVHLGDARAASSYRRSGVRVSPGRVRPSGVFAMPVLPDYFASHQWLRELKRRGVRTFVGVYFRVPDAEPVFVGHYRHAHAAMSAVAAARLIMDAPDARGYEVIIPRRIGAAEVQSVRSVNRVVGWRFYPEAKGRQPFCRCKACNRGEIRAKRLWAADEDARQ